MKLSQQVISLCEDAPAKVRLDKSDMEAVKKEVAAQFEDGFLHYKDFEDFWEMVDRYNGYEDGWEEKKDYWKPYYAKVFNDAHKAAKPKPVKNKRYAAVYKTDDGKTVYTIASKSGGHWLVGGDVVNQGYQREIFIYSIDDEKIYKLKGSHLVPMDNMGDSQLKWFNDNWEEISTKGIIE